VQNQEKIEYPQTLVAAKAYLDQLERSQALPAERISAMRQAIQKAESSALNQKDVKNLKSLAASLQKKPVLTKNEADSARLRGLTEILRRPAL
jgi:hypothetical protein